MAIIRDKNFSGQRTPLPRFIVETYISCNFSQPEAITDPVSGKKVGVPLFPDHRGISRQFIKCNLVNCDLPPNSLVEDCNTSISGEEVETEVIRVKGVPITRVKKRLHVAYGYYEHKEDGTRVRHDLP